jgi:hypothetical protein
MTNTFNTFWKGVERDVNHKDKKKSDRITEYGQDLNKTNWNTEKYNESSDKKPTLSFEDKAVSSNKVLEPLEVLVNEKQLVDGKENESNKI